MANGACPAKDGPPFDPAMDFANKYIAKSFNFKEVEGILSRV